MIKRSLVDNLGVTKQPSVDSRGVIKRSLGDNRGVIKRSFADSRGVTKQSLVGSRGVIKLKRSALGNQLPECASVAGFLTGFEMAATSQMRGHTIYRPQNGPRSSVTPYSSRRRHSGCPPSRDIGDQDMPTRCRVGFTPIRSNGIEIVKP